MGRNNDNMPKKSVDLLINSVLNNHGVTLNKPKSLSRREKQEFKKLVNDLKRDVQAINKTQKY